MGSLASKFNKLISDMGSSQPRRVLMLGLDAAGKTTILYKLKLNECVNTIPTIGFNVEEVKVGKGLTFTMWDVGGQEKIRPLWKHYMTNCQALIYVVDSSDIQRLNEAKEELFTIAGLDEMRGVPVIILANKQDLPHARTTSQIADTLELQKLERHHKWHLQACCAISGEGLYEAMGYVGRLSTEFMKKSKAK